MRVHRQCCLSHFSSPPTTFTSSQILTQVNPDCMCIVFSAREFTHYFLAFWHFCSISNYKLYQFRELGCVLLVAEVPVYFI